eukprot:COSAG05_NODE_6013_length_1041_cov_1.177282_3_plen_61_part_01
MPEIHDEALHAAARAATPVSSRACEAHRRTRVFFTYELRASARRLAWRRRSAEAEAFTGSR